MKVWLKDNRWLAGISTVVLLFAIYFTCSAQGQAKSLVQRLEDQENISSMERFFRDKRTYPHREKAQRLIAENRFEEALLEYNAVLTRDPGNLMVSWLRLQLLAETSAPKAVILAAV